jgi:predicted nucleic acid-binding protein
MYGILVDSNILLDIFLDDPDWADWSESVLNKNAETHPLYVNAIIYTEISIAFDSIELLESILVDTDIKMLPIPKESLFLAGKAFLKYKKRQGTKHSPLPDFYIGAQAAVLELPILTRDRSRYQFYFPTVKLLCP